MGSIALHLHPRSTLRVAAPVITAITFAASALACGGSSGKAGSGHAAPPPRPADVSAEDVSRAPSQPIEKLLMSRTPGIVVSRSPEGYLAIRIRGATSLQGNTEPLYIIDGMAVVSTRGGGLAGLNPYDIESIRVLKDPAELTMYGSRGANGVIVIRTRKPQ